MNSDLKLKSKVLVVVDMQPVFAASKNILVQKNCKRLIKQAMQEKDYILYLEYRDCGKTLDNIKKLTYDYCYSGTVVKSNCGGGYVIKDFFDNSQFSPLTFTLCGVNSDMCVQQTAYQLAQFYSPPVDIIVKKVACGTTTPNYKWDNYGIYTSYFQHLRIV